MRACALAQQAGLLHPAGAAKLLHVFAEVALAALCALTGLATPASSSPAPSPSAQSLTARHPLCSQLLQRHTWRGEKREREREEEEEGVGWTRERMREMGGGERERKETEEEREE